MNNNPIDKAREKLLIWIACGDKRSYESIRKNCIYLDTAYGLGFADNAVWELFAPLLRTGIVEHTGKDNYAIATPIAIERNGLFVYTGLPVADSSNTTPFTGFFRTQIKDVVDGLKISSFNAVSVLRNYPSIDKVVDSFNKSVEDLSNADYYHWRGHKGLTKRLNDGMVRYYCVPEKMYQREIPGREINPDAFNIAYSLSRSLNGEHSGVYTTANKTLTIQRFGLPIMIERVLFLESLTQGLDPYRKERDLVFLGINKDVVKELNRILCNTVRYE